MSSAPRIALTALGLTEIYTLLIVAPLVHYRHSAVYHWSGHPLDLFLPAWLDIFIVWALMSLLLSLAHFYPRSSKTIWTLLFLVTPWVALCEWDLLWRTPFRFEKSFLFYVAALGTVLVAARLRHSVAVFSHRLNGFVSTALLFFGFGGALLLGQLIWFTWQARALNARFDPQPSHASSNVHPRGPRIVWIIFDELSYQQVYERRFPGLELPAFDALAAQSTIFTHAVPAGNFTDSVLPSLMSGEPVDLVRSSASGQLSLHNPQAGKWQPFDQHATVFQDALDLGYTTAVVGWYLPYCRVLPAVLDRCFWSYNIGTKSGMSPRASIAGNMWQPIADVSQAATRDLPILSLMRSPRSGPRAATLHIDDYRTLTQTAIQTLSDPSLRFVFLHLPVPHLGGIYNRARGQMTTGNSTYLDNLALADKCLAQLRLALEETGQWDSSTIVVAGDHSWRTTPSFRADTAWSTEEDKASQGGTFDDRPAYIVKLAGQEMGSTITTPFPEVKTRSLLDSVMKGSLKSSRNLSDWVAAQP